MGASGADGKPILSRSANTQPCQGVDAPTAGSGWRAARNALSCCGHLAGEAEESAVTPSASANPSRRVIPGVSPTWATRSPIVQSPNPPTPPPPTPSKPFSPSPAVPNVTTGEFISPVDRQQITGPNFVAAGHVNGLSSALLCIVRDESGNNFPYTAQSGGDGRWDAAVGTGPQKRLERWYSFTLILATATRSALDEIEHQRQADEVYYNEHGVGKDLPSGIAILAEVGIIRTS